jgi:hypothetical protein
MKTHHLQLVLPKLLLARFVQEGEISDMVNKDIPKDRQLGFLRRDLAVRRFEWGTETTQGRWRVEFVDLPLDLLRYELPLEVCEWRMSAKAGRRMV